MRRLWSIFTANASIIPADVGRATNLWIIIRQVLKGKKVMLFHMVYLLTRLVYQDCPNTFLFQQLIYNIKHLPSYLGLYIKMMKMLMGENSTIRIPDDP